MNEEYNNYITPQPDNGGGKGLAIASMVCGILSIVLLCIWYMGLIAGVLGIVLGVMHAKKNGKCGMSTAGIVCGIIGIVLTVAFLVLAMLGLAALGGLSALESYTMQ